MKIDIAGELMRLAGEMSRAGLEGYVVGIQPVSEAGYPRPWRDIRFESIDLARIRYDRGEVELAQERTIDHHGRTWFLLYAIPRKERRQSHLNYFGTRMSMVRSA